MTKAVSAVLADALRLRPRALSWRRNSSSFDGPADGDAQEAWQAEIGRRRGVWTDATRVVGGGQAVGRHGPSRSVKPVRIAQPASEEFRRNGWLV
jgi:hypothetical protein